MVKAPAILKRAEHKTNVHINITWQTFILSIELCEV